MLKEGLCGFFLTPEKGTRSRTLRNALVSKLMERRGDRTRNGGISEAMEVKALVKEWPEPEGEDWLLGFNLESVQEFSSGR